MYMYTCTLGGMSCLEREAAKRGRKRRKLASKASLVNDGVSLVVEQATRVVACPFPFRTIGATVSKKHTGDFVIAVASAMLISGKWWVPTRSFASISAPQAFLYVSGEKCATPMGAGRYSGTRFACFRISSGQSWHNSCNARPAYERHRQ